jgi:hypothetical protein
MVGIIMYVSRPRAALQHSFLPAVQAENEERY